MKPIIVTIGRQFGSGGREIGKKVAEALHIPFYDRELLAEAAQRSDLTAEMFETYDEQPTNSFLYSLSVGAFHMNGEAPMPLGNQVFLAMTETIKEIAAQGSCVIVGRCAEYVLGGRPELLRVFVRADIASRARRIASKRGLEEKEAISLINKTDKKRANYHNFYSDDKWGASGSYDLVLNTGVIDVDRAVDMIVSYAQAR